VTYRRGRRFRVKYFGDAKINQHCFVTRGGGDNIGRFDITVDNWWVLLVQIRNGIHYRSHDTQHLLHREAFLGLLLAQFLQVWPINIIHEHISPVVLVIFDDVIDAR